VTEPELSVVVVAWHAREDARELARAFADDPRFELVIVDNSGDVTPADAGAARVRLVTPERNLGFGAGSNAGARAARAPRLLFLNPDARPRPGALDRLLEAFARWPDAAGLVPRLVDEDGSSQCRWQLKPLPGPGALLAHAFFWNPTRGPRREPPAGAAVGQPAAAALALRRSAFERLGGFDERYFPAWFEDVDLARRLAAQGGRLLYAPEAEFVHRGGASVASLGYGAFLEAYDRNLARYLRRHHGRGWELAFRALVPLGALARLALLPLRRPRRAASRRDAAVGLWRLAAGAAAGWPPGGGPAVAAAHGARRG
jgi:GT2 family glycosyltransferase